MTKLNLKSALLALSVVLSFSVQAQETIPGQDNGGIHGGGGAGLKMEDGSIPRPLDIAEVSPAMQNGKAKYFDINKPTYIETAVSLMLLTLDEIQTVNTGEKYRGKTGLASLRDKALRLSGSHDAYSIQNKGIKKFKPMTFVWSDSPLPNINDQGVVSLDADTLASVVGHSFITAKVQLAYQTDNTVLLYRPELEKMMTDETSFRLGLKLGEAYFAVIILHEALLRATIQEHPEVIQKYGTEPVRRLVQMLFEITWLQTFYPPELKLEILHNVGQDREVKTAIY